MTFALNELSSSHCRCQIVENQVVRQHITAGASEIPQQGVWGDVLQIPDEVDLLHAHDSHTCGGTNDEDAAARAGAVGQENPEHVIHREIVHTHGTCHQRHIVDDGRQNAYHRVNQIVVAVEERVEAAGEQREMSSALQSGNGQQNTEEEEDAGKIDARKHSGNR